VGHGGAHPGTGVIALVFAALWALAAAGARVVGIWVAVGGMAIVLGLVALRYDRAALAPRLRPTAPWLLLGALAAAAMVSVTQALHPLIMRLPLIAAETGRLYAAFRRLPPTLAAVLLVPIVLGEELVWRGVVQGTLERRFSTIVACVLAAAAYGLVHAPLGSLLLVATAAACGAVWSGLRAATGSLVPSLISHLVWDGMVLLWRPLE